MQPSSPFFPKFFNDPNHTDLQGFLENEKSPPKVGGFLFSDFSNQ